MTVRTLFRQGYDKLFLAEVDTPLLDALLLLAFALESDQGEGPCLSARRGWPRGRRSFPFPLDRRSAGTPVSYIRRIKEFWGLEFYVDERVLVPRPDTEALVEKTLDVVRADPRLLTLHDACAGSGCIGIALQRTLPRLEVSASDLSAEAGVVLRLNAEKLLGRRWTSSSPTSWRSVPGPLRRHHRESPVPPRRRGGEHAEDQLAGARRLPLRGGRDGTALAERLIRAAPQKLADRGWLVLEALPISSPSSSRSWTRRVPFHRRRAGHGRAGTGSSPGRPGPGSGVDVMGARIPRLAACRRAPIPYSRGSYLPARHRKRGHRGHRAPHVLPPEARHVFARGDGEDPGRRGMVAAAAQRAEARFRGSDFIHPLSVASILVDIHMDYQAIVAALLHDVLEDTETSRAELRKEFGREVEFLVQGVTKISVLRGRSRSSQHAETIRKMLFAMVKDIRVILIKLADKLQVVDYRQCQQVIFHE